MQWSQEKVLEFLELFQTEPCLWNPQLKGYKNRGTQNDAWYRIKENLQFPTTIEDLKKKKESLMGYYRFHLHKLKKSLKSGGGGNEIYNTTWFAFDLMDSFLRPVYEKSGLLNKDTASDATRSETSEIHQIDFYTDHSSSSTLHDEKPLGQVIKHDSTPQSRSQFTGQHSFKKRKVQPEIIAVQRQMDDTFDCMNSLQRKEYDEYDHFGLMIAAKIRKINDPVDRETLMNTIQNVVFQTITKHKK
ncbi:unnamed protein product [Euphydryas editha]|uniref:MADF domain-containing protein n=1 Tax=Euphydryas editha TaxID=104508 RepID=A0AAU9U2I5_EUPED|nr:unnamed protein product [Euphydryas editha]